jgi:hypothetical protein
MSDRKNTPVADQPDGPDIRLALRPKDAAKALGIGERLLWEKTDGGDIPHLRIGAAVLYPVAVLERWLAAQAEGGDE